MKILAMMNPGTNSRGLLEDIVWGFERLGHDVLKFELEPMWALREALGQGYGEIVPTLTQVVIDLIARNDIDLSIAMWANGPNSLGVYANDDGTQTSAFDRHDMPHYHIWWDAPHWANGGVEHDHIAKGLYRGRHQLHSVNNPATAAEMATLMGFPNVLPLPNGVNPERFRPRPDVAREFDLVCISGAGDPPPTDVCLEELARDEPDIMRIRRDLASRVMPSLAPTIESFGAAVRGKVRELCEKLIEQRVADRHAPAASHLQQVVERQPDLGLAAQVLVQDTRRYVAIMSGIRAIETWERPFMTAYLSKHFKCLRLGSDVESGWPVEAATGGWVDYDQQSEAYARAHFALNVMRWQDDVGVNSKAFEITACGVGCLHAYRGGLDELFEPDRELLIFRTPGEARAKLAAALASPDQGAAMAAAGRARTLRDHTWDRRMALVAEATEQYWRSRGRSVRATPRRDAARTVSPTGERLAFVISPMRSGSTLLRKMLDAHPRLASPPETWFMLPLTNLWNGHGAAEGYNLQQATAALKSIASRDEFIDACRAFASSIYSARLPQGAACLIDKTPMYLGLAPTLEEIFPDAKFLILVRDPRGTVWSFHTWEKVSPIPLENRIDAIGPQVRQQYDFARSVGERGLVVRYEDLCREPAVAGSRICGFLGCAYDSAMLDYGANADARQGYGDEKSQTHRTPHADSLRRWSDELTLEHERRLARGCTEEALRAFGYDELASTLSAAAV